MTTIRFIEYGDNILGYICRCNPSQCGVICPFIQSAIRENKIDENGGECPDKKARRE